MTTGFLVQGRPVPPGSWDDYVTEVAKAAKRPRPRERYTIENLKRDPATLHPPRNQCTGTAARTGQRCKQWAVKGTDKCHLHGGARLNPRSKAAVKAYRRGEHVEYRARREAREELKGMKRKDVAEVTEVLKGMLVSRYPDRAVVAPGVRALNTDDGGKSWRRWLGMAQKWADMAEASVPQPLIKAGFVDWEPL